MIHDGEEGTPVAFSVPCPACGGEAPAELWTIMARASTEGLAAEGLEGRAVLGRISYQTSRGLTAYRAPHWCPCGAELFLIVGMQEVQPCRYQAELHAVRRATG